MSLLEIDGLEVAYGRNQVLWGVDLAAEEARITALVGANGAGKTTLLRSLTGLIPHLGGSITFDGSTIDATPAEQRVRLGIAIVQEGRKLFAGLSILENLRLGAHARGRVDLSEDLDRVWTYFPEIKPIQHRLAGSLSGGQQQMCAVGRALMARPKLLLIDEMSLGLAPIVVGRLAEVVADLSRTANMTILLVEQDVDLALEISDWAYVLETGRIAVKGSAEELRASPEIRKAYMGLA